MATSASALYELLTVAQGTKPDTKKFLDFLVEYLELSGGTAKADAVRVVNGLVVKLFADVEALPFADDRKKLANSQIAPFRGLLEFSHFHLDIKTGRNSFLKPECLTGLLNIDMALSGISQTDDIEVSTKEISEELRDIRERIANLSVAENVRRGLLKRTTQLISVLEHYHLYRDDQVEDVLEGLVGQLVLVSSGVHGEDEKDGVIKKLGNAVSRAFLGISKVNKGVRELQNLAKGSEQLASFAGEVLDKVP
ncbi:hypothetical protein A9Q94_20130 [Rhodobacterales bacterium 56_14_T64]|nr:hypothetical protein A9Q94_20130 [Rhodobacterales bacterium 56_14_T64]